MLRFFCFCSTTTRNFECRRYTLRSAINLFWKHWNSLITWFAYKNLDLKISPIDWCDIVFDKTYKWINGFAFHTFFFNSWSLNFSNFVTLCSVTGVDNKRKKNSLNVTQKMDTPRQKYANDIVRRIISIKKESNYSLEEWNFSTWKKWHEL